MPAVMGFFRPRTRVLELVRVVQAMFAQPPFHPYRSQRWKDAYDAGDAVSPATSETHRAELLGRAPAGYEDAFAMGLDHGTGEANTW